MTETKTKRQMAPYPPRRKLKIRGDTPVQSFYANPGRKEILTGLSILWGEHVSEILRKMLEQYLSALDPQIITAAMDAYRKEYPGNGNADAA